VLGGSRQDGGFNPRPFQQLINKGDTFGLVAGRIGGIKANQPLQQLCGTLIDRRDVT
jgi:hypothetical protein